MNNIDSVLYIDIIIPEASNQSLPCTQKLMQLTHSEDSEIEEKDELSASLTV